MRNSTVRPVSRQRRMTRMAILLALMIVIQSLRFILPLPSLILLFLIGTALNACLICTTELIGLSAALGLALLMPLVAFFQQAFFSPLFVLPALIANIIYLLSYVACSHLHISLASGVPALLRTLTLYAVSALTFAFLGFNETQAVVLQSILSVTQLATGVGGILLCRVLLTKFHASMHGSQ